MRGGEAPLYLDCNKTETDYRTRAVKSISQSGRVVVREIESDDDVRQIGFQTPMGYTHKHCRRETMIDDDERLRPRWVSKQRGREDFKNKANRNRLGSGRFGSVQFGSVCA